MIFLSRETLNDEDNILRFQDKMKKDWPKLKVIVEI